MDDTSLWKRAGTWVALIVYCALIAHLSHQPGDPDYVPPFAHFDKLMHVIEYAVFAVLLLLALSTVRESRIPHIMIPATVLFAISDEIHQSFVPLREASAADLLADFAGAAVGGVAFFLVRRRVRRRHHHPD